MYSPSFARHPRRPEFSFCSSRSCLAVIVLMMLAPVLVAANRPAAVRADPEPADEDGVAAAMGLDRFKLRGRLQVDVGHIGGGARLADRNLGTLVDIRRVRLGAEGEKDGFGFVVEVDFAGNDVSVEDGFGYWTDGRWRLMVGNLKPAVSMEEQSDDLFVPFMERAAFTTAFGFGYSVGAAVAYAGDDFSLRGGVLSTRSLNDPSSKEGYIPNLRLTYAPKVAAARLHLAASLRYRKRPSRDGTLGYAREPQIHQPQVTLVDTGPLPVSRDLFLGVEGGVFAGPFYAAAEWGWLGARLRGPEAGTARFSGGYAGMGYVLTGERAPFDPSSGTIGALAPAHPLGKGGKGALVAHLRFDRIDLDDPSRAVTGGRQNAFMAGATWIPVTHVRLLVNITHLEVHGGPTIERLRLRTGNPALRRFSANVIGMRAQIHW